MPRVKEIFQRAILGIRALEQNEAALVSLPFENSTTQNPRTALHTVQEQHVSDR